MPHWAGEAFAALFDGGNRAHVGRAFGRGADGWLRAGMSACLQPDT